MYFQKYFPNLESYLVEFKDKYASDTSNQTLKNFIFLMEKILKQYYSKDSNTDALLLEDISRMSDADIADLIHNSPELKNELEFYLQNRKDIEALRLFIESSDKVKNVANDFFRKNKNT